MTAKELIIELLKLDNLDRKLYIQIDKSDISDSSYRFEYFNISDIVAYNSTDATLETEVDKE